VGGSGRRRSAEELGKVAVVVHTEASRRRRDAGKTGGERFVGIGIGVDVHTLTGGEVDSRRTMRREGDFRHGGKDWLGLDGKEKNQPC
jgi:hypothetical protein